MSHWFKDQTLKQLVNRVAHVPLPHPQVSAPASQFLTYQFLLLLSTVQAWFTFRPFPDSGVLYAGTVIQCSRDSMEADRTSIP